MQPEDRVIHFSVELVHAPVKADKEGLQKLYYDLSQSDHAAYDSSDFSQPSQVKFHSRRGDKTQSVVVFLRDRVVIAEEWTDMPLSAFLDRVVEVGSRIFDVRGVEKILAHTATVRSTFALTHYEDARVFLLDNMCGQEGRIGPHFKRPVAIGGLKFVLPETPQHTGTYHVAIESFRHSRDEVFSEVKGVYARPPLGVGDFTQIVDHVREVRSFVSDGLFPYLNQYDIPQSGDSVN